ncbi:hypothetical protein TYRP_010217 [Tyrophagus putrescentiae]|nr:hypothetical protein TYRP_010217 [Tyrophagus putrescentiae]
MLTAMIKKSGCIRFDQCRREKIGEPTTGAPVENGAHEKGEQFGDSKGDQLLRASDALTLPLWPLMMITFEQEG